METSSVAVDMSADRLVSEVLSSAAKPAGGAHSTTSYGAMRGESPERGDCMR